MACRCGNVGICTGTFTAQVVARLLVAAVEPATEGHPALRQALSVALGAQARLGAAAQRALAAAALPAARRGMGTRPRSGPAVLAFVSQLLLVRAPPRPCRRSCPCRPCRRSCCCCARCLRTQGNVGVSAAGGTDTFFPPARCQERTRPAWAVTLNPKPDPLCKGLARREPETAHHSALAGTQCAQRVNASGSAGCILLLQR